MSLKTKGDTEWNTFLAIGSPIRPAANRLLSNEDENSIIEETHVVAHYTQAMMFQ